MPFEAQTLASSSLSSLNSSSTMTGKNLSTTPPTLPNPLGTSINVAISITFVILTIVVGMRLWGRYRYRTPGHHRKPQLGEPRFWILLSDLTIILSYVSKIEAIMKSSRGDWQLTV